MLRKLFGLPTKPQKKAEPIIVISGLPRSGTSMMMKMLAEGGLPSLTDQIRSADEDNPNGYYEFEPVKQLAQGQLDWLDHADRKAVKIISALLEYLSPDRRYQIIFMERQIGEILASQKKMLIHRNETSAIEDAAMQKDFEQHLAATKFWLARQSNIDVLYVNYNALLTNPRQHAEQIVEFLGLPLDVDKMSAVPSEGLYRNRSEANQPPPA